MANRDRSKAERSFFAPNFIAAIRVVEAFSAVETGNQGAAEQRDLLGCYLDGNGEKVVMEVKMKYRVCVE